MWRDGTRIGAYATQASLVSRMNCSKSNKTKIIPKKVTDSITIDQYQQIDKEKLKTKKKI